jgi:hypothetical protein
MKHAAELGLGSMTYMPRFVKTDSDIQMFIGEDSQWHGENGDCIG